MTDKEFEKFDLLIGFVNNICEIVSDPEECLDFNTKDSSIYSIGYDVNKKGDPVIYTIDGENSISALRDNLSEIERLVKAYSRADFSKKWAELQE